IPGALSQGQGRCASRHVGFALDRRSRIEHRISRMKRRTVVGLAFLIIGQGSRAWAAGADAPPDADTASRGPAAWETAPATRRGGFTAGVLTGLSFGSVVGYPNDFAKIDQPAFRSAT